MIFAYANIFYQRKFDHDGENDCPQQSMILMKMRIKLIVITYGILAVVHGPVLALSQFK